MLTQRQAVTPWAASLLHPFEPSSCRAFLSKSHLGGSDKPRCVRGLKEGLRLDTRPGRGFVARQRGRAYIPHRPRRASLGSSQGSLKLRSAVSGAWLSRGSSEAHLEQWCVSATSYELT